MALIFLMLLCNIQTQLLSVNGEISQKFSWLKYPLISEDGGYDVIFNRTRLDAIKLKTSKLVYKIASSYFNGE